MMQIMRPGDDRDPQRAARLRESAEWAVAVRARRRALGLTQRDVAALAGVAERTVIAVERASRGVRLGSLVDVLAVLGLGLRIDRGRGIAAGDV
jgi:HTH-type transcriptional regulator/antitoxin HipB